MGISLIKSDPVMVQWVWVPPGCDNARHHVARVCRMKELTLASMLQQSNSVRSIQSHQATPQTVQELSDALVQICVVFWMSL